MNRCFLDKNLFVVRPRLIDAAQFPSLQPGPWGTYARYLGVAPHSSIPCFLGSYPGGNDEKVENLYHIFFTECIWSMGRSVTLSTQRSELESVS